MVIFKESIPFIKFKSMHHDRIKENLLNSIQSMGEFQLNNEEQKIKSTDWHLDYNYVRPYFGIVRCVLDEALRELINAMGGHYSHLQLANYWFQQYGFGDFHAWHLHNGPFSAVYYVDLDGESPKTTFKFIDKEFEIDVAEGDVLLFPCFLLHTSKENKSKHVKTVVAFNFSA